MLHPARLRSAAVVILVLGMKRERAPATESGAGPARREEDFVGGFPLVIIVNAFKLAEGPREVEVEPAFETVAGVVEKG